MFTPAFLKQQRRSDLLDLRAAIRQEMASCTKSDWVTDVLGPCRACLRLAEDDMQIESELQFRLVDSAGW